ncbi:MAG: CBS domain-containing protein [Thermodesulfobacteriota bacterium]
MEVIVPHTNADFDAFASMVAAKKLYPGARVVFSGSTEKAVAAAIESIDLPFPIDRLKDIDLESISTLVLVDVRQPGRIGRFSSLVGRPGVEVHVYDHHPPGPDDIRGTVDVTLPYGSTTSVLTHILKERGMALTPLEATILMAGIYEDTGSLVYPSTTVKDYEAAAFLLEAGADLAAVADMLRKELSSEEVSLLSAFLDSEISFSVAGTEIVVAQGYLEKNIGDISMLAHKMQEIEGMDTLFMLVDSVDRVHVIARSRVPEVDVGAVCKDLGGGGHPNAASATIKGITLIQAKEMVLAAVRKRVAPARTATEIMSYPAITARPESTLMEAVEVMRRYNINAMPVVTGGAVEGVITRQVADKAAYHGLGGAPVEDYMTTECEWVEHDTSIEEIRERVIGHGQRILPVVREGRVVGVITRTDLLKLLQEELLERPRGEEPGKARNLARPLKEALPAWAFEILIEAGRTAEELGCKAYVVGGIVRDLLLRIENLDIDIVVEGGDGVEFAYEFARRGGLRVRPHHRFKTAVVIYPDGFKVDVATARLEYYERPGALPTVEQSSLKLDLYRRDFIINTLAVALNPPRFGELIDFFGAQKDIREKTIRVLHNLSFVEDPTRALRAVRFSVKFGFKIGTHTRNLIKNSLKHRLFEHISGARLLDEVRHILDEDMASRAVGMLDELGLLGLVHEKISWDEERRALFDRAHEAVVWHRLLYTKEKAEGWLVLFLALTDELTEGELEDLAKKLKLSGRRRFEAIGARTAGLKALARINAGLAKTNSALYDLMEPLPLEVILYLMARSPAEPVKKALSNFVTKLKGTKTILRGWDLLEMGVAEGPRVGEILKELLCKRLDGELATREDEEGFVRTLLESKKRKRRKTVKGAKGGRGGEGAKGG